MDEIAPEKWAEPWDNVGLLLGDGKSRVERLMVVLDISPSVVEEAIDKRVDMIIAHHPLIFNPLKRIVTDDLEGRIIIPLLSHNIAVYCAHTNLDMANGGVDDSLAKILGLKDVRQLNPVELPYPSKPGFGRWGKLDPPQTLGEFAKFVRETINSPNIEIIGLDKGEDNKPIETVALCAGSGSDFLVQAQKVGADLFITGEIKYHDALTACWLKITTMSVGHFYSEMPAIKELFGRLQMIVDSLQYKVEIFLSEMQSDPYSCIIIDD